MKYIIHQFEEIDSTMNYARQLAENGCSHFTVVIAKIQKNGRGRLSRKWISEKGGLYFTIVLKPKVSIDKAFIYNLAASAAVVNVLEALFRINSKLKWPNDIHISDKKICGILSEIKIKEDVISYINIGIGLNVNNQIYSEDVNSVSVKELTGKEESEIKIFESFLSIFEQKLDHKRLDRIILEWKQNNITIGSMVKIKTINKIFQGLAIDIDRAGALVIITNDFMVKKVMHGDCFHDFSEVEFD